MLNVILISLVFIISALSAVVVSFKSRGIVTEGRNSDADKQIEAASMVSSWKWISDMHRYAKGKGWLKDVAILFLILFQRLFRDYKGFHPVVTMCAVANSLAAIMLYLTASIYWGNPVGFLIFLLYIFCCWQYQVILQGGYQPLGVFFFLASVNFMQLAGFFNHNLLLYLFSGSSIILMMLSSASSRKLLLLLPAVFFIEQHQFFKLLWLSPDIYYEISHKVIPLLSIVVTFSVLAILTIKLFFDKVIELIYFGKLPGLLKYSFMSERGKHPLGVYLNKKKGFIKFVKNLFLKVIIYLLLSLVFSRDSRFYLNQIAVITGFLITLILFVFPRISSNLAGFYSYWTITKWGAHFPIYKDYFAKKGIFIKDDMRGAGIKWYPLFFWRMIPFHFFLYGLSISFLLIAGIIPAYEPFSGNLFSTAGIIFLSLLPIIYSEITGATQFSRTYSPVFVALLIPIGYALHFFIYNFTGNFKVAFLYAVGIYLLFSSFYNIRLIFKDILPARMSPAYLRRKLQELGIKDFYTYNNSYNKFFVFALPDDFLKKYNIHFINSLSEAKDGYVLIPGTSSKSSALESDSYAAVKGDFREDALLNKLLDSKEISKYAVSYFKTVGSSKMWGQEGEIPTYRDLILKEVTDSDRFRALAWIIDAKKLQESMHNG